MRQEVRIQTQSKLKENRLSSEKRSYPGTKKRNELKKNSKIQERNY